MWSRRSWTGSCVWRREGRWGRGSFEEATQLEMAQVERMTMAKPDARRCAEEEAIGCGRRMERERRGQQMPAGLLLMFVFAVLGCACLGLMWWWTEVVFGCWRWLGAGQRKLQRAAERGCDVRSRRGLSLQLWLQQGPQPRFCLQVPTLSFTIPDNESTLYLLDHFW